MRLRTLVALSIAAALGAILPPAAWSASSTVWSTSPTAILGSFFERANSVLRAADPARDLESPRRAIRGLVAEVFDFREAAAIALGPVWRSRTPQEQEEFIWLFADLLERGYIAAFSSKANMSGGGVTVHYLAESVSGESASVPTRVLTRTGEELPVEYRLARRGERWTVRDVIVDGVSLVANYRAQFTRILGTSTFPDLMVRMRSGPDAPIFAGARRTPAAAAAASTAEAPSTSDSSADRGSKAQADAASPESPGAIALPAPGLLVAPAAATQKESAPGGGRPEVVKTAPVLPAAAKAEPAKTDAPKTDRARTEPPRKVTARADTTKLERPIAAGSMPAAAPPDRAAALAATSDRLAPAGTALAATSDRLAPAGTALAATSDRAAPALAPKPDRPAPAPAAPAAKPPAPPATASLVPTAKYWVQLGAFQTLAAARLLESTLRPETAVISSGPGPGAGAVILNRVRVGPFADHAQAAAKLRELDDRGYPGFSALTQD